MKTPDLNEVTKNLVPPSLPPREISKILEVTRHHTIEDLIKADTLKFQIRVVRRLYKEKGILNALWHKHNLLKGYAIIADSIVTNLPLVENRWLLLTTPSYGMSLNIQSPKTGIFYSYYCKLAPRCRDFMQRIFEVKTEGELEQIFFNKEIPIFFMCFTKYPSKTSTFFANCRHKFTKKGYPLYNIHQLVSRASQEEAEKTFAVFTAAQESDFKLFEWEIYNESLTREQKVLRVIQRLLTPYPNGLIFESYRNTSLLPNGEVRLHYDLYVKRGSTWYKLDKSCVAYRLVDDFMETAKKFNQLTFYFNRI